MLKNLSIVVFVFFLHTLSPMAQDIPADQLVPKGEPVPSASMLTGDTEVHILSNCYTSDRNCTGRAYFKNTDGSRFVSYRYNYASGGYWNFVLAPGSDHWVNARGGDTYASAWGNSGVPSGTPTYWVWVCCN